jgi:N-acyl-phosphatidylethanolamine-hydrolysing phospholipase D
MDPGEALHAFRDLGARHMFAMHWGAFDLTDEPVDLAPRVLAREVARTGEDTSRVHVLAVGERFRLP